jgi:hypothetical protein
VQAPQITVQAPQITVQAPQITVQAPQITVQAPQIAVQDYCARLVVVDLQGYSSAPKCHNSSTPLTLVQRCNHHSNRVLEALLEGSPSLQTPDITHTTSSSHINFQLTSTNRPESRSNVDIPRFRDVAHSLSSWQLHQVRHHQSRVCDAESAVLFFL